MKDEFKFILIERLNNLLLKINSSTFHYQTYMLNLLLLETHFPEDYEKYTEEDKSTVKLLKQSWLRR